MGPPVSDSSNWEEAPRSPRNVLHLLRPLGGEGGAPFGARHKSLVGGPGRGRPRASGPRLRKQKRGWRGSHLGQVWLVRLYF